MAANLSRFLRGACPIVSIGEILYFMKHTFADWLLETGDTSSRMYDFGETRPLWKKRWFRITLIIVSITIALYIIPFFK